ENSNFSYYTKENNLTVVNGIGIECKADDVLTKKTFAIKKIVHPFLTTVNAKRTYREFILLTTMKHPNIINLESAFTPQHSIIDFEEIYFVMEFMNYNLAQVIRQLKLDQQNLSYFTYQLIVAIKYMHRSGIIHRDLKPTNIVVNDKCVLKVLDFGLARKMETTERMSMYVVTRHYRAPEIILGLPYTEKVDVWAIGCILAEMILQKILFPGTDRIDQWSKITNILGSPPKEFINRFNSFMLTFCVLNSEAQRILIVNARDLLTKMLKIDPNERISLDEAVQHPYIHIWFAESEWNAPLPQNRYDIENDLMDRPIEQWRELLYNEVKQFERNHEVHG
ncbi:unnamed protein product, partial [Dracunculus medinensis]|uniref:Mitogen-activated protein kinase n=1 Tax=Dracunculus medinensis TaxID=318479 RepID=A0A0N4UK35_DRAME